MMIKTFKKLVIMLLFSLVVACSGDNSDLSKYMNEIKSRPAKSIEPIPQFPDLPVFKFPANDPRRSPFKPVEQKKRNEIAAPDQNRSKDPLEFYPLDALKFVGTLKENNKTWGLIRDPDGKIVRVRIGEYMGQDYGVVISIKDEQIKLEETFKNAGKWEKRITTIDLDTGKGV